MILRVSQKLAKKIKETSSYSSEPLDSELLADWSCHLFTAQRVQYIILCNTVSFYSALFYGRGVNSYDSFVKSSLNAIREAFEEEGFENLYLEKLTESPLHLSKAHSRQVTGTINEQVHAAKYFLEDELAPWEVAERLNKNILSVLKYGNPKEKFRELCQRAVALPDKVIPFPGPRKK